MGKVYGGGKYSNWEKEVVLKYAYEALSTTALWTIVQICMCVPFTDLWEESYGWYLWREIEPGEEISAEILYAWHSNHKWFCNFSKLKIYL